jgi:hypothetical protein
VGVKVTQLLERLFFDHAGNIIGIDQMIIAVHAGIAGHTATAVSVRFTVSL